MNQLAFDPQHREHAKCRGATSQGQTGNRTGRSSQQTGAQERGRARHKTLTAPAGKTSASARAWADSFRRPSESSGGYEPNLWVPYVFTLIYYITSARFRIGGPTQHRQLTSPGTRQKRGDGSVGCIEGKKGQGRGGARGGGNAREDKSEQKRSIYTEQLLGLEASPTRPRALPALFAFSGFRAYKPSHPPHPRPPRLAQIARRRSLSCLVGCVVLIRGRGIIVTEMRGRR